MLRHEIGEKMWNSEESDKLLILLTVETNWAVGTRVIESNGR